LSPSLSIDRVAMASRCRWLQTPGDIPTSG
jgi:hypothetical protein